MNIKLTNHSALPFWIPLFAIALRMASAPTAGMSYFLLAAYALKGRIQTIQALTLSWLFSMLNSGVAPVAGEAGIGRYVVLTAATITAIRFGFRRLSNRVRKLVMFSLLFGITIIVHSVFFSMIADVSILKAISWLMAICSLIVTWGGLADQVRAQLIRQIFGLLIIVMLLSLPFIYSPIGYMVNRRGFQGILGHPQAFGAAMGLLGAWAGSSMLAAKKPSWLIIGLFSLSMLMIIMSEARTGALSLIIGLALAVITVSILSGQRFKTLAPGLASKRLLIVMVVGLVILGFTWSGFSERIGDFFVKRTESQSLADAYDASRGGLIDDMLANIEKDPFIGIGFGIGSYPDKMIIVRDSVLNLPVSAIIEKGVLPVAILEELGVIGFVIATFWFFTVIRLSSYGGLASLAVCLTALLQNLGDSMFFSASGMGLILIILVAWAATKDRPPVPR